MISVTNNVSRFPAERVTRAVEAKASRLEILYWRARGLTGRMLTRFGLPGAIQPFAMDDSVSGDSVSCTVGDFFVRLTVNGRDYYFDRVTGRPRGTGSPTL